MTRHNLSSILAILFSINIFSFHASAIVVPPPTRNDVLLPPLIFMESSNEPASPISAQLIDKGICIDQSILYLTDSYYELSYVKGIKGNTIMFKGDSDYLFLETTDIYRPSLFMKGFQHGTKVYLPGKKGKKQKGCVYGFRQDKHGKIFAAVIIKKMGTLDRIFSSRPNPDAYGRCRKYTNLITIDVRRNPLEKVKNDND